MSYANFHLWHAHVPKSIKTPALIGAFCFLTGVAGFGAWASTAHFVGATTIQGTFIATGQNKIIQHLEGGIIRDILVAEGDTVSAGQSLMHLDATAVEAKLSRLAHKRLRLLVTRARLEAERHGNKEISFTDIQKTTTNKQKLQAFISEQKLEFETRKKQFASELGIYDQRIAAINEERNGLRTQSKAIETQLELMVEELKVQEKLFNKGHSKITKLLASKRVKAQLEGRLGELMSQLGQARGKITEIENQITSLKAKRAEKIIARLARINNAMADVEEHIKKTNDIMGRLKIRAPVKGVIVKLFHNTPSGVLAPGEKVLELLPIDSKLIVEARVTPDKVDAVNKGKDVQLNIIARDQRTNLNVPGEVIYVSADTIKGGTTRESHYVARIRINEGAVAKIKDFKPTPGMPVDIFIGSSEETFLKKLLKPLLKR